MARRDEVEFWDGQCRYLFYEVLELPREGRSFREVTVPVTCDERATETVVRRSHRYPDLAGPIDVCGEHAGRVEQESELDDAIAEGSIWREIESQKRGRCVCVGHEHVGEHCPRPCGCAVRDG